jgi:hypothetical protein
MPDLLPDDFGTETNQPPLLILREQAEHLGRKTGGLVTARVDTLPNRGKGEFIHTFVLEVPALDYAYTLFSVRHPITFYPLNLQTDGGYSYTALSGPEAFEKALREVFAGSEFRKIVAALKAQALATVGANTQP